VNGVPDGQHRAAPTRTLRVGAPPEGQLASVEVTSIASGADLAP